MTNGVTSTTSPGGQAPNGNIEKRLAALEAVFPSLATKADLAELRAEMRVQDEQLRAEMRVQNEQLRAEISMQNNQLRAEISMQNKQLRAEISVHGEQLRTEMERLRAETQRLLAGMFKWMIATILTIVITFVGLGNILLSRLSVPGPAPTSTSVEADTGPASYTFPHHP